MKVEAWVLESKNSTLIRKIIQLNELGAEDVLIEPIYGCWEGNMGHALDCNPINVCEMRNEAGVVLGNAGVVRVLKTGSQLPGIIPGEIYLLYSGDTRCLPRYNYPIKAFGYDAPGTVGLLAKQTIVHFKQLFPIPLNTQFSLKQWAAFSLRYITAWGNWKVAHKTYRAMVDEGEAPNVPVWGWGGGVSLGILQLAKAAGFQTALITANSDRLNLLKKIGIAGIDRSQFLELDYRSEIINQSKQHKDRYLATEKKFLEIVTEKTNDHGVAIFIDLIGEPVLRATLKALARPGVLTTAGWKKGMHISYLRAIECIQWHSYIHTHYASLTDAKNAMIYAENNAWLPPISIDEKVYAWDEIGQLAEDYRAGKTNYFPIYQVN